MHVVKVSRPLRGEERDRLKVDEFCRHHGKRLLDLIVSIPAFILAAPLIVIGATLVTIAMGWPPLFFQRRPGQRGHSFTIIKLRTMTRTADETISEMPDANRLTRIGRLLRATSLDELPELWNVLRGDMSLVGPRPLLVEYLPRYDERQSRRHEVRPGITGWAQVNGRNALTWEQKFELDVWYVENVSFVLDLKILWRTLLSVARREGISAAGSATMPEFRGNAR